MNRYIKISLLFSVIMGVASAQSSIEGTVTDNNGNAQVQMFLLTALQLVQQRIQMEPIGSTYPVEPWEGIP